MLEKCLLQMCSGASLCCSHHITERFLLLRLLCKPLDCPKVAAGGAPLPPLSFLKTSGQNSLFQMPEKSPSSSKPPPPVLQCGVRHSCTQSLSAAEKQTHPCPALYPAAADPCSLTSCSEFVSHDHKPGKKNVSATCVSREPQEFFLIASLQL